MILKLFNIIEGPAKLPLVGSLHYFYGKPRSLNRNIKDLISKFGRIAGIFIGSQKVVVIADLNLLKGEARFNFIFTLTYYLERNIENSWKPVKYHRFQFNGQLITIKFDIFARTTSLVNVSTTFLQLFKQISVEQQRIPHQNKFQWKGEILNLLISAYFFLIV